MSQYVFFFGGGKADGNKDMKDTLGGKGSGLAEMTNAGVPVPPGFTISTQACNAYYDSGGKLPAEVDQQMDAALAKLEALQGKKLGDPKDPLLVSVRSGSKFSMPGMMDTILNLGMNDKSVAGVEAKTGNPRFARDSYRRFIQMYGNVVLGIDKDKFEHELSAAKKKYKAKTDVELDAKALDEVIERYKAVVLKHTHAPFPQEPRAQLVGARDAVFKSWMNPRAITYRKLNDIAHNLGTAVNVQVMVFGNMGDTSATGVGFTRNPSTGAKEFYGEFLQNAQGEDVVSGVRTPHPIADLEGLMPAAYKQLREITTRLERHYKDVQDFEFTIQENTLYMLQTRNGKRTGLAAVQIAVDMCEEGVLTKKEALLKVEPQALDQLLHPIFDPKARLSVPVAAKGLPASPGAATGAVVFTADDAVAWAQKGKKVLLVRMETVPDDIHGMSVAQGILTATGGMTSHAAVVGRQMGKPSVVGCGALDINAKAKTMKVAGKVIREGDPVSIDGSTGEVMLAAVPTSASEVIQVVEGKLKPEKSALYQKFEKLLGWADEVRRLGIRANADVPKDAKVAFGFGARGHRPVSHRAHVLRRGSAAVRREDDPRRRPRAAGDRPHEAHQGAAQGGEGPPGDRAAEGARQGPEGVRQVHQGLHLRPQEARADAEGRLRRALQGDARLAGHHPHPRPAAPRVPAQARGADGRDRHPQDEERLEEQEGDRRRRRSCCGRWRSSTSSTRCWVTAAAASASPTPRSPRCRRRPSSRRPCRSPRRASR